MSRKTVHPFAQLMGHTMSRVPQSGSTTLVVDGQRVTDLRKRTVTEEEERAARAELARELQRTKDRAGYQRDRLNPEKMAKRAAYYEANREKVLAKQREYYQRNRERILAGLKAKRDAAKAAKSTGGGQQ